MDYLSGSGNSKVPGNRRRPYGAARSQSALRKRIRDSQVDAEPAAVQSTIVIPLSSSGLPEDIAKARKYGADDYLIKPATLEGWRKIGLQLAEKWFDQRLKQRMPFVRANNPAALGAAMRASKAQAS